MTDTVETRIRLSGEVHRAVKAEAARHGITLAEALGMCVAFVCGITRPLGWRANIVGTHLDFQKWLDGEDYG